VEDDHVDRPGVQARRRVEPTGTNRPTGLIAPVIRVRTGSAAAEADEPDNTVINRPEAVIAEARRRQPHACRRGRPPSQHPAKAQSQTHCDAPAWWPERRAQNPIPSRTRPLNTPAPMVLCLKTRESRSPPGLPIAIERATRSHEPAPFPRHAHRSGPRTHRPRSPEPAHPDQPHTPADHPHTLGAGWSSPVARQAHNLKVTGSNPVPATKRQQHNNASPSRLTAWRACVRSLADTPPRRLPARRRTMTVG
jgi:hypothetical protein